MAAWVRAAPDKESYQRRLAVSLVVCERCHVPDVARMLHVAPRSVWRWLGQYNAAGPTAVIAQPRGGRRGAHLSLDAEAEVLHRLRAQALRGEVLTASDVRPAVERALGRPMSRSYLYDLLRRHDWRKLAPRPRHPAADPAVQAAYKKTSHAASVPR
jgi:transposase